MCCIVTLVSRHISYDEVGVSLQTYLAIFWFFQFKHHENNFFFIDTEFMRDNIIPLATQLRGVKCFDPSISQSVHQSIFSFPDFFSKSLQILTWFFVYKFTMISYRSRITFVPFRWFFTEITGLELNKIHRNNSFPDFFSKRLQMLTWFLICKVAIISYRSSICFVPHRWFLPKLRALNLTKFTEITVFRTFFYECLQILPWFLVFKFTMISYRTRL